MGIFFTSDWHLGDPRTALMGRPFDDHEDMAAHIAREYDKVISDEDTVYIVGDAVARPDWNAWKTWLKARPGYKVLIRGNHDRHLTDADLAPYFDEIIAEGEGVELTLEHEGRELPVWVTHYPLGSRADLFNLVAHIHSAWKVQKNMLNVGVDAHHFRPLDAAKVIFYYDAICGFYDRDVWVENHPANTAHADRGQDHQYFYPKVK